MLIGQSAQQFHRLNLPIDETHIEELASGQAEIPHKRRSPALYGSSDSASLRRLSNQIGTDLDHKHWSVSGFARGSSTHKKTTQLGRGLRGTHRTMFPSNTEVELSLAHFDEMVPGMDFTGSPSKPVYGAMGKDSIKLLSSRRRATTKDQSRMDSETSQLSFLSARAGQRSLSFSEREMSKIDSSESDWRRAFLSKIISTFPEDHGGRRGPPSSSVHEKEEFQSEDKVGGGHIPRGLFAPSSEKYADYHRTEFAASDTDLDVKVKSKYSKLFPRFHVPTDTSDKSFDSFNNLELRRGSSVGYKRVYHPTTDEKPTGRQSLASHQAFDYERVLDSAWKRLGYRSYGQYLQSSTMSSQLTDDRSLAQIEPETFATDHPWSYHVRPDVARYMRSELRRQATEDSIIGIASRENPIINQFTPRPVRDTSFGLRIRTMQDYWPSDQSASAKLDKPALWTNQFSETKTVGVEEEASKTHARRNVRLEPNPVQIPGVVTARCPSMITSTVIDYKLTTITWIRAPLMTEYEKGNREEIVQYSLVSRMIKMLSRRDQLNKRAFIFPPKKWPDSHTLDIAGLVLGDFGFYICVATFSSVRNSHLHLNITKKSEYPLCIMPPIQQPLLVVTNVFLENNTESQVADCYSPNTAILVQCKSEPYRLFCEKPDYDAHGNRLLDTILIAYLHLHSPNNEKWKIEVKTPENVKFPLHLSGLNNSMDIVTKHWILPLREEYAGADLYCRVEPSVSRMQRRNEAFISWLDSQFNEIRRNRLSRQSSALKICISSEPRMITIDPEPRTWLDDGRVGLVEANTNQAITCTASGENNTKTEIKVFPILPGKAELAYVLGPNGTDEWLNKLDYPPRWHNYSRNGKAGIFIPSEGLTSEEYLLICTVEPESQNQVSNFQIYREQNTSITDENYQI